MAIRFITFTGVPVSDQQRALDFYTRMLGFEVLRDSPYGEDRWIEVGLAGGQTTLLLNKSDRLVDAFRPALSLTVDDIRETANALKAKGVTFMQEPTEAPWAPGQFYALFKDSEGNIIILDSARLGSAG